MQGAAVNTHSKIRRYCHISFLSIVTLLSSISFGKDISFFIPKDHVLSATVDSLFQEMNDCESRFTLCENRIIRDKAIREDKISVKGQYLSHSLKHKLAKIENVVNYCKLLNEMLSAKETYFNTLLSALEGDNRAACFNFLKSTRSKKSEASALEREFSELAFIPDGPVMSDEKSELQIEDNLDGGLDEMLTNNNDLFSYDQEMKVEKVEREEITKDTAKLVLIDSGMSTEGLLDMAEDSSEHESMINSMASFFESGSKSEVVENEDVVLEN